MDRFQTLVSRAICLTRRDIDTDQIIPARFLKTTKKTGLGQFLFADVRYEHPLNIPDGRKAQILIARDNFGCGSSREHAVWALLDSGFRVVISTGFADIFKKNALRNGLLPIAVAPSILVACSRLARQESEFTVSLEDQTVTVPGLLTANFEIDSFARIYLLEGADELEYILRHGDAIARFERQQVFPDGRKTRSLVEVRPVSRLVLFSYTACGPQQAAPVAGSDAFCTAPSRTSLRAFPTPAKRARPSAS